MICFHVSLSGSRGRPPNLDHVAPWRRPGPRADAKPAHQRGPAHRCQHRQAAGVFEQEMMRSRLQPPKQTSLCAIAATLMLSFLLPGPAAGVTQRYCPTKPHAGRHDGVVGRRGPQMCRVDIPPQQAQGVGAAARRRGHGIQHRTRRPKPQLIRLVLITTTLDQKTVDGTPRGHSHRTIGRSSRVNRAPIALSSRSCSPESFAPPAVTSA